MKLNKSKFASLQKKTSEKRELLKRKKQDLQTIRAALATSARDLKNELVKGAGAQKSKVDRIKKNQDNLHARLGKTQEQIVGIETDLSNIIGEVLFSRDPRDQIALLDDNYPVFLIPVRIETRFMTVKHIARVKPELPPPLETPILTIVGGIPVAAPQLLSVGALFEGRTEIPVIKDAQELWIRIFPDDIAIHTHEDRLTESEIQAAQIFWNHIWYAGEDRSLQIGAWRGLVSGRGPERAAWIAKQMEPANPQDKPAAATDPAQPLPYSPVFPTPGVKSSSWSHAPHTRVMPERFVARLYTGSTYREVVGETVADSLQLGPDPLAGAGEITSTDGLLELADPLKWMKDFEEAEKTGMAIRVPLMHREHLTGFDRILVLGVKAAAGPDEGQALLEELIDNHHYRHGGFSIVPQGTPTNNTEDVKSGYTAFNSDDEELFDIELKDARFEPSVLDLEKTDGQRLAEALGISYKTLQHIRHADRKDIREAMLMNRALWPTTFGYFLSQMMHPVFSSGDIIQTRSHFNQYVLGRGKMPAIRINNQPYGILPATAFSKWTYPDNSIHSRFLNNMHKQVLKNMETTWDNLSQRVKYAGGVVNSAEFSNHFLDIVGLHPSSVEFYQRFIAGPYFLWNLYNYSQIIQKNNVNFEQASYATSLDFLQLFNSQNYSFVLPPRVFDFFYLKDHKYLDGPLIDTLGLSELRTIQAMGSQGENYIHWLAKSNWNEIKAENFTNIGAPGAKPPTALLYLMLRHSTLLEYVRTSLTLLVDKGILATSALIDTELMNLGAMGQISMETKNLVKTQIQFKEGLLLEKDIEKKVQKEFETRAAKGELEDLNLKSLNQVKSEYKAALKSTAAPKMEAKVEAELNIVLQGFQNTVNKIETLTASYEFLQGITLADYIRQEIFKPNPNQDLIEIQELVEALNGLADLPTARLERCFAEHIDLASYRLDAWFYSLVLDRLENLRNKGAERTTGVYLGAYSWLEDIRPGSLPGIHYREVDITPDVIVVPGFREVALEGLTIQGQINTGRPWLSIQDILLQSPIVSTPTSPRPISTTRTEKGPPDPVVNDLELMPTSGAILTIQQKVEQAYLNTPLLLDVPVIKNPGPPYVYLGKDNVGDITYDPVIDKFIHNPRVDPGNQGYIHAPSINQATAAAVLRSGYVSHNASSPDNKMAINLSSDRVRRAMYFAEGMKNGQELAALLGYQFERGLHDRDTGLDAFILEIRTKYPLVAGRVTDNSGVTSISSAEAYNVVNGLELVENSRNSSADYPYGVSGLPNSGSAKSAIIEEVDRLHDSLDAISDLLLSESMYQVVQGNFARANGALNAMGGQSVVIDPEVIKTPRKFHVLSHRLGVQFDLSPNGHTMWTSQGTARSLAEPFLNRWLSSMLPDKNKLLVNFQYRVYTPEGFPGAVFEDMLSLGDLGLEPIDLYCILTQPSEQGDAVELVNRIAYHVRKNIEMADRISIEVLFTFRTGFAQDELSLFELQPLIDQLHAVVGNSRHAKATDFLLSTGAESVIAANPAKGLDTAPLFARLSNVAGLTMSNGARGLLGVITDIQTEVTGINTLISNVGFPGISGAALFALREALTGALMFGVQNAVPDSAVDTSETIVNDLLLLAARVLTELEPRQVKAADLLSQAPAASSEDQKLVILSEVARQIFGRSFKVYPEYRLYNDSVFDAALQYPDYLNDASPFALEEWLQGLSPVRKRTHAYHRARLLSQTLRNTDSHLQLTLSQLPLEPLDESANVLTRWLGVEFPKGYRMPDENISFVLQMPNSYSAGSLQAGIIVDEWVEEIPEETAYTGVAIHYNNPNSEPPQSCLLAVSPDLTGQWSWDDLMDTLSETLDWSKKRAVDPDLLNDSLYAQVLPAIFAAVSASGNTPTLDFGRNIIKKPTPGKIDLVRISDYIVGESPFDINLFP